MTAYAPPVIVVGAGRSGTNLLRDVVCSHAGFGTWPCDEINYIWRFGNRDAPTDELQPDDARPNVLRFIRNAFTRQLRRQGGGVVVEKTCANSLRLAFVNSVFPEARFLYIERDGRDVITSAMSRWTAPMEAGYLARKARFVPKRDLPHYFVRYFGARVHRLRSSEGRLSWWGPRIAGYESLAETASLAEVCARQWKRCTELANDDLSSFEDSRVYRLRYEDLVANPFEEIDRLRIYLGADVIGPASLPTIRKDSVGRWRTSLSEKDLQVIDKVLGPM